MKHLITPSIALSFSLLTACSQQPIIEHPIKRSIKLPEQQTSNSWYQQGNKSIENKLSYLDMSQAGKAKNIILFVGDGMGISTLTAARILQGQIQGQTGEENYLSFERFPFSGLAKTYNTNQQTPDSAGTMSAIMTGIKTDAGVLAVDESVKKGDCKSSKGHELVSALEIAELAGKSTGMVTTARITHATPAATYAKTASRDWENNSDIPPDQAGCDDIALQLINFKQRLANAYPNLNSDGIEVILGGGRRNFLPNQTSFNQENPNAKKAEGKRTDTQNLISQWQNQFPQGRYVNNRDDFINASTQNNSHLLGLFHPSHMRYGTDAKNDALGEPSLSEMTSVAIDQLSHNKNGYFLMVEAGRIDHGHHAGNAYNALHETIALSDAVEAALKKVDLSETLIIVTADHSHVMTMAGYPKRGNPILGKVIAPNKNTPTLMADGLPYTTLGYLNGRGMHDLGNETDADAVDEHPINVGRKDISNIDTTAPGYHQEALIPRNSETHGGEDVAIFATGQGAHLVTGVNEQNVIFHIMMYASGLLNQQ